MPALMPTTFTGKIIWLGIVPDRGASLKSQAVTRAEACFGGFAGEAHGGITRPSDSRVVAQHRKGTTIANVRQFSILSVEEIAAVAAELGLERAEPEWFGASILIEGIPDFSHIPPSSRLQTQSGTTLVIDMENRPCHLVAKVFEDETRRGKGFKQAAHRRRGVTAWVEREGPLAVGDTATLHIPDQPVWAHLDAARSKSSASN